MQALGLIETRGLLAAVESADAMLKSADVTLLDKTYVGGGLVSIAVTGGVAAVKAAVEAGAAAVRQINDTLLISSHVIPRPHEELDDLILPIKPNKKVEVPYTESDRIELREEAEVKDYPKAIEPIPMDISLEEIQKEHIDKLVHEFGFEKALKVLNRLKVTKLRNLAREYKNLRLAGRMISKADKKMLIEEFREYYKKN